MALLLALAGTAHAALFDRGGGMIYDSTRNLTWLADMNYAKTSGYNISGLMTWAAANTWADNLVFGGYDNWRLPTALNSDGSGPCAGFNCTGGELSGLFITDLGNKAGENVTNPAGDTPEQIANLALFSNLICCLRWTSTPHPSLANSAMSFDSSNGSQGTLGMSLGLYAVAVRPGDVAAVPEPQAYLLMLLGLGVMAGVAKRQRSAPQA